MTNENCIEIIAQALITNMVKEKADGGARCYPLVCSTLPINVIDGIHNIFCEILLSARPAHSYRLSLLITVSTNGEQIFKKHSSVTKLKENDELKAWLVAGIKNIQSTLKTLRVSAKRTNLTVNYEMDQVIWKAHTEFCEGLGETIGKSYDNCCVCDEVTTLSTHCKHFVCIVCASQLKKQKCPMCRQPLVSEDVEEDDSDDSDSDASDCEEEEESDAESEQVVSDMN